MSTHSNRIAALRTERAAVQDFCRTLTPTEWDAPSNAAGWRVRDVIAHIGASAHAFFTPALITVMRTKQIERLNDDDVSARADRRPAEVLDEFVKWTGLAAPMLRLSAAGPMGAIRIPLGELGHFPLRIMPSTAIFDWHVHLRHDIAPAIDRPVPPTDEPRMAAVIEWLTALLEQSHQRQLNWLHEPVVLTLVGLGGGSWVIEPRAVRGRFVVRPSGGGVVAAHITARSEEFPTWATTRVSWRESDVTITGDDQLAANVLDSINLV